MILPIYPLGHPILRQEANKIDNDSPELQALIDDMIETMHSASGIGIAAPQVGQSLRLFVADLSHLEEDYEKDNNEPFPDRWKAPLVFINPEITEASKQVCDFEEGCLSIPDVREIVARPASVRIKFQDRQFNAHDWEADRILARVIQHEYDHIEGVLFIDHLSSFKRRMLKRKLQDVQRGKIETEYKMFS